MLKINKILSKKIIFPLSLRGAFPHVIARERSERSNLNPKGFSLIELMVAVGILAIAIFGIFLAFSTSFQGMADARDRTVASNYMREIMEDIKNTDFEKIEEKAGTGAVTISGKTFTKVITVEPSVNLKKISTIIYWENYTKSVQSDMLVHFMQTTAGDPARIMLFAYPYKITPGSTSELTAIVKDEKGNNVNFWSGDITFSITYTSGSDYGSFSTTSSLITTTVNTSNGQAFINYIAPGSEVDIIIEASATGLNSDSVNLTVTAGAVKIALSVPDNNNILSPGANTIITAKLVDADNILIIGASADITFSVSETGNLTSPTTRPTFQGTVDIDLSTSLTPGIIKVTASSPNLDPGTINIITGGIIDITSTSNSIPIGESEDITVNIKDLNGIPINYNGYINLSSSSTVGVIGSFSDNPIAFDGNSSSTFSYSIDNFSLTGILIIEASDTDGILNSDSISFEISEQLIPFDILVTADPQNIVADGVSISEITATVKTEDNRTVESFSGTIIFDISNPSLGWLDPLLDIAEKGVAHAVLTSFNEIVGQTSITAEYMEDQTINGIVTVGFYLYADDIVLTAVPSSILKGGGEDGTTIITAIIKDGDVPVDNFIGTITFSIILGYPSGVNFVETNKGSLIVTVDGSSTASVELESKNWTGTAEIKVIAWDGISIDLGNTIYIQVLDNIELNLVDETISYTYITENIVSFDIEVLGAAINLEEMQYSWLSSSVPEVSLNIITIDGILVYSGAVGSDEIITIFGDSFILSPGTHNIVLDFENNVYLSGQHIEVTFYPDSDNYPVDFTITNDE